MYDIFYNGYSNRPTVSRCYVAFDYFTPGGVLSIVICMSVCLSVCQLAYLTNQTSIFSVRVTYGRGSVLSSFDNVLFSQRIRRIRYDALSFV